MSDYSASDSEYSSGYDDDFYKGSKDKRELMNMPMVQREAILFERREEASRRKSRLHAQRALRDKPKNEALLDIRARRENRGSARSFLHDLDDIEAELSSESDDEPSFRRKPVSAAIPTTATATPLDLATAKSLQARRELFEASHSEPWFEEYVSGMYVRVGLGPNSRGEPVYRMAEVRGLTPGKSVYKLGATTTRNKVVLRIGAEEQLFRMEMVSNSGIKPEELDHFLKMAGTARVPVLTKEAAVQKRIEAETLRKSFRYTDAVVDEMLSAKREEDSTRNFTEAIFNLTGEIERKKAEGDMEEASRLSYALADLQERDAKLMRNKFGNRGTEVVTGLNRPVVMKTRERSPTKAKRKKSLDNSNPFIRVRRGDAKRAAQAEKLKPKVEKEEPRSVVDMSLPLPEHIQKAFTCIAPPSRDFRFLIAAHADKPIDIDIASMLASSEDGLGPSLGYDTPLRDDMITPPQGAKIYTVQEYLAVAAELDED